MASVCLALVGLLLSQICEGDIRDLAYYFLVNLAVPLSKGGKVTKSGVVNVRSRSLSEA